MRILLCGIPGWLGSRFLEILVHGFDDKGPALDCKIRCLVCEGRDASSITHISRDVEIIAADITRKATLKRAVKDIDIVFDMAGIIHPGNIKQFYLINTQGTRNLISESLNAGVKRFIYISSNSAAGTNQERSSLMKEEDSLKPYMNYGLSKHSAEGTVRSFQEAGGIQTVILRPCWFYGPNQPRRQTRFFKMIQGGRPVIFGDGMNFRSLSYVDNVCQGMILAATKKEAVGQTYWIADARPYTTLEIYQTLAELLEVENFRPRFIPGMASKAFRSLDKILQAAGMYQTEVHVAGEMDRDIACSIKKAKRELGYDPAIELREGMRRSIQWCRSHNLI